MDAYRVLIENITDYAIYMLDSEGCVASWNAGAQRFKGYCASEIIGRHFSNFYTEEDRADGLPLRALTIARTEGRFENEGWRLRKDGSRFWAHVVIDPIRSPSGDLIGYAKITRDLTERKESERALERTREALVQAQKMEAIGQLTGGVAHDFNNLLSAVLGSLELAQKHVPDPSPASALMRNAVLAARRGAAMTQRMLAFARRQELKRQAVDVVALVRGMADLMQRSIGPAVTIETRFPLNLPLVWADPNQLETALLNLAVNARDAMPEGGPLVIAVRAEAAGEDGPHRLTPGEYVCISVTDAGEGMDEETLSRAMEPFFTTKGVGKGTGLGLSMVHGLAEQFGGRLTLASRLGQGTTAEIWLPVSSAAQPVAPPPEEVEPANVRPLRILAVDDDDLVLMNTAAMLEDFGHTVLEANSGPQALDLLRRGEKVDLVISDHAMPRMTGSQMAAEIAAKWPELPIVLATGYAELPEGGDAAHLRLAKPFTQAQLQRVIGAVMRARVSSSA
ncbi:PAS domain-containing sensor histidine kinase [Terrarubrum flagellatum]|uniref:PAS domain-containing sensor histidine kinase n=1 Tax=Terrirubrum flagellatum TaxID=2895980 RepID=UPI00314563EE